MIILLLEGLFFYGFIFFAEIFVPFYLLNSFLGQKDTVSGILTTEKEELNSCEKITETFPMWGLPKKILIEIRYEQLEVFEEVLSEPIYEQSEITAEQELFFDSLLMNPSTHNPHEMLSIQEWNENPEEVNLDPKFTDNASSTIGSYQLGEQLWIAEIVGEEQGFLHVSDGTGRAWINAVSFGRFFKGDILSLLVNRETDQLINLVEADILQEYSRDFSLVADPEYDCITCTSEYLSA